MWPDTVYPEYTGIQYSPEHVGHQELVDLSVAGSKLQPLTVHAFEDATIMKVTFLPIACLIASIISTVSEGKVIKVIL